MATTVAHGLIGISVYCAVCWSLPKLKQKQLPVVPKALLLAAIAANIPDLDIVVSFLLVDSHRILHGAGSHSFFFAALVATVVWGAGWFRQWTHLYALVIFLAVSSHVVVDWLTGPHLGLHSAHGVAFLWPFIETPISAPITLFKGVNHSALLPGSLYTAFWELLILGPIAGLIVFLVKRNNSQPGSTESC